MPATKKELKNITHARLLEAAVLLFSRDGFNGTGTRDIARVAETNESTLFRHYRRKTDLFWAALESRLGKLKLDRELQRALASEESPRTVVPMLLDFFVRTMHEQRELMRLLYISALELPGGEQMYQRHLGAIFDSIKTYFGKCESRSVIPKVDPQMLTLAIAGTVIATMTSYELFIGQTLPSSVNNTVAGFSDFWCRMLCISDSDETFSGAPPRP